MKADPEVKMISAEAPILFAKGCDIFITELTMRAWIHAEENKRRTLQRSDIASALAKSDMFDFLIDIVPREEAAPKRTAGGASGSSQHHAQQPPPPPPSQPSQHAQQPHHAQQPPSQQMPPSDYLHGGIPTGEPERYNQGAMYPGGVSQQPTAYPSSIYQEGLEGMYGYPPMPPQGVWPSALQ